MKILIPILLFAIFKTFHCENIQEKFEKINKKVEQFNAIAAEIAWESSVKPGDPKLVYKSVKFQKDNLEWQHRICDEFESLDGHSFNSSQLRQKYLLCRGPKYTYDEARLFSALYEELQTIYTDAKICIPTENYVPLSNLTDAEVAIIKYLKLANDFQKRVHPWQDPTMFAVKNAVTDVAEGSKTCLKGEDDFQNLMAFSRNEEVLKFVWLVWREKVGPPMKDAYKKLVDVENFAARRNGYRDIGATWRDELEMPNLRQICRHLYEDIKPFYALLHGVARFFLRKEYGNIVPETGPIPAHLLGNLWSQNWEPIADLIFPKVIDLDERIKNLNWTVHHMVKRAEDFYQSLGLPAMTDCFWNKSLFSRDNNKTRCHGAAADMFKDGDYRLMYCSGTTKEDFYVIHHELGHIHYYMAYKNQPALFRQANTAFHEAIGDTIMYGVMTPQHLHRLGLINDSMLYNTKTFIIEETIANVKNKRSIYTEDINNKECKGCDERTNNEEVYYKPGLVHKLKITKEQNKSNVNNKECKDCDKKNNKEELLNNLGVIKSSKVYRGNAHTIIRKDKSVDTKRNVSNENSLNKKVKSNKLENIKIKEEKTAHNKNKRSINTEFHTQECYDCDESQNKASAKDLYSMAYLNHINISTDDVLMLKQALNKIPQIPFSLLIDEFRWRYFEGDFDAVDVNKEFWKMAEDLQGIAPPMKRREYEFDIGAKFHVPDNTPYIRYFLSSFLQHQLFESVCKAAVFGRRGVKDPLPETITMNRCDIYGSKAAGKLLKDIMSRGHSQHWQKILQETTGQNYISAAPLKRYYLHLYTVLEKLVQLHRIPIGW